MSELRESVIHLFDGLPAELTTFIIAMLPIVELRGAIPFAALKDVPWYTAFMLSVVGNMVPIVPILMYLGPVSEWLRRLPGFGNFFDWLFARTRKRGGVIQKYGAWGLILFVAIPLPVTGAWTGSAAAFLFGIPFRKSFPAILAGVVLAGIVVTLAVKGVISLGGMVH